VSDAIATKPSKPLKASYRIARVLTWYIPSYYCWISLFGPKRIPYQNFVNSEVPGPHYIDVLHTDALDLITIIILVASGRTFVCDAKRASRSEHRS
jgi:hypothetical protein